MKLKKYLSLSPIAAFLIGAHHSDSAESRGIVQDKEPVKTETVVRLPELKVVTDTLRINDKNFDKERKTCAAGLFTSYNNKVSVRYFVDETSDRRAKYWCDRNNELLPIVLRHEMEHARKANLVHGSEYHSPYVNAQIAAMNEVMAPVSEAIEAIDRHCVYGRTVPHGNNLPQIANLVMDAHNQTPFHFNTVDFSNQHIADLVLNFGMDKFVASVNRGFYKWTIRKKLDSVKSTKYTPNTECDFIASLFFLPECDMWGPMFTFDTAGREKVDIWNSASEKTRQRVLQRLDSVIYSTFRPGEILYRNAMSKIR